MIAAPQIEVATSADVEALARLRVEIGWYRSESLLRGVLAWEGGRNFLIRAGALGETHSDLARLPAATTTAIAAGPVGVIGNVAVRPEFQRRGLGKLLMTHAIEWQRSQGVRSVWLDATPAGRPLYRRLGFTGVAASWVAHSPLRDLRFERLAEISAGVVAEPAPADALARIAALDLAAFGGDRMGLLHTLAAQDEYMLYLAHDQLDAARRPLGFALARQLPAPREGIRLGPLIAAHDAAAAALVLAAAHAERQRRPAEFTSGASSFTTGAGDTPTVRAFYEQIGAPTVDDDLVMRLAVGDSAPTLDGYEPHASHKEERPSVYSWIAPMLF